MFAATTPGDLQARLPLRRLAAGEYETDDGSVRIVNVGPQSWAVIARGEPIEVLGIREFSSLTEAHGKLADAADLLHERRAA